MTIKEYLKDHSERELVEKIFKCLRVHAIDRTIKIGETIAVLKNNGIEIEEEDYLAKARALYEEWRKSKLKDYPNEDYPNIDIDECMPSRLKQEYEKAIKQLQEKK
jgi:hypothetical protein